jgi:diguanylate cyclase
VVTFVFVVGLVNLGLGFLAAVALTEPPPWNCWRPAWVSNLRLVNWRSFKWRLPSWPSLFQKRARTAAPVKRPAPIDLPPPPPPAKPAAFRLEELPQRWLELLRSEHLVPGSCLEASSHVMRLEVSLYREQLITAENRTRAAHAAADAEGLRQVCDDLVQFNSDWLARQTEAGQVLKARAGGHGDYERAASELEQVLHDQAALIKDCDDTVAALHCRTELETGCKRIFERIAQLIDQTHALRDRLNDLLATLLRTEGGLDGVNTGLQHDHATGLPNRIGLELVFQDWWREDPDRQRQLTAALIDADRFARVNQRLGTRVGDHTIGALAKLLGETFRRDRGSDRLVRMSGQSLLVFFGDTGPQQALAAVERARQTIEATTWDDHGTEFELTISAGLCEVRQEDSLASVLQRLTDTLKHAKLAGRNRASIDEGDGPQLLDPPQFSVKGRIVAVGNATT